MNFFPLPSVSSLKGIPYISRAECVTFSAHEICFSSPKGVSTPAGAFQIGNKQRAKIAAEKLPSLHGSRRSRRPQVSNRDLEREPRFTTVRAPTPTYLNGEKEAYSTCQRKSSQWKRRGGQSSHLHTIQQRTRRRVAFLNENLLLPSIILEMQLSVGEKE